MPLKRFFALAIILLVLGSGAWLLGAPARPAAESLRRSQHLGQLSAPVGLSAGADALSPLPSDNSLEPYQLIAPTVVDVRAVPQVSDGASEVERWRQGEIDLDEQHHRIDPAAQAALQREAAQLAPSDRVQQIPVNPDASFGSGFASLDFEDHASQTLVPPDPELAVGPHHIIAVSNAIFEIYDHSGNSLVGPIDFRSFFSSVPACSTAGSGPFDPNVLYDEQSYRYLMAADGNGTHYCLAVSATSDPTGSWYLYPFFTGVEGHFFDFPQAGVGRDAIYMGANMFDSSFVGGRIWAFDKVAMYQGLPAAITTRTLPNNSYFTPQPMHLHGFAQGTWPEEGPHYFLADLFNGRDYTLFSWTDPFGSNSFTTLAMFDLSAATGVTAGYPLSAPQLGNSTRLQANDWRLLDLEYRNGHLWTTMTISCNPGSGTVDCIRWAEIDPVSRTIVQAGVFSSGSTYRIFPDLAVDHDNNLLIGYTKTSSYMYPGVWAAYRGAETPAGQLVAERVLKSGERSYSAYDVPPNTAYRWGDYTGLTIAPDGCTFWYLGQYSKDISAVARWGTYIRSFTYDTCPATTTIYLPLLRLGDS